MACITKRRNRWIVDFYDQHGVRRWKTLKKGTTKAEAKDELRSIEDMISNGVYMPLGKTPVFKEVAEAWLEFKKPYLRETTWEVYQIHVKCHFHDLNELKINKITTATIEKWITKRQTEGQFFIGFSGKKQRKALPLGITEKEALENLKVVKEIPSTTYKADEVNLEFKKMSISTIRKIIVSLNQIMAYSVRHKLIDSNPVRDAERPRKTIEDKTGGKIAILTPEQIRALLDATPDQKYKTLFLTAIMTGARQGETLGLKWSDVDFEKKQIHIRRTFNGGRFFSPKTKESVRAIDLAPMALKALAEWKLKSGGKDDKLIFPNEDGGPMNYSNMVQRHFHKALKKAGIGHIRWHDLRHGYASLLIQQGENIKYIQSQLGHSSPTVTLNVYSHLMKSENQEAACRLEESIFSSHGSNLVAVN
jgi:integrase